MIKQFCDRCNGEIFKIPTIVVRDLNGSDAFSLCEQCALKIRKWVGDDTELLENLDG